MQIAAIRKVKRNVQVILDSGEELLIRYEIFLKNGLRNGDPFTDDLIQVISKQNKIFEAKEKAFNLLTRRNHSSKEIERKLLQRKFDKGIVTEVIIDLQQSDFLNDERFTREYVEERLRLSTNGLGKIKKELYARGIPREIINTIIDENSDVDETDNALELAKKKMKSLSSRKIIDKRKLKQKIYSFLLSKGFDYETIENAYRKIITETGNEIGLNDE
ncbi:MAG: regulatory protein RecX [Ignavibacteriales bacterium]|nr:regulatory protein RecX [Ignavibacteriales bacterium]